MLHIKGTAVLDTFEAIKARAGKPEWDKIISHLDPEAQEIFGRPISPPRGIPATHFHASWKLTSVKQLLETNKNWSSAPKLSSKNS